MKNYLKYINQISWTSVKVIAANFFNRNQEHDALNSFHGNVIAIIITKMDIQTSVVMFYCLFKYQINVTSLLAFMD